MCDRQEIQYNFQQALTQADKLDDVADCLRRISENSMEESRKCNSIFGKGGFAEK